MPGVVSQFNLEVCILKILKLGRNAIFKNWHHSKPASRFISNVGSQACFSLGGWWTTATGKSRKCPFASRIIQSNLQFSKGFHLWTYYNHSWSIDGDVDNSILESFYNRTRFVVFSILNTVAASKSGTLPGLGLNHMNHTLWVLSMNLPGPQPDRNISKTMVQHLSKPFEHLLVGELILGKYCKSREYKGMTNAIKCDVWNITNHKQS